jgi:mono/diheme cytochrome c family protein
MRSRKWYFAVIAALSLLAARGLYADFRAGYYTPAGPETIHQMLPNAASTDATYDAGQYPIYYPELAAGEGKDEVENNCELCHSPRYITMQPPLPAQAWADEVNKMRKTYGASIPDDAAQKIIQYLGTHYTPETRKR